MSIWMIVLLLLVMYALARRVLRGNIAFWLSAYYILMLLGCLIEKCLFTSFEWEVIVGKREFTYVDANGSRHFMGGLHGWNGAITKWGAKRIIAREVKKNVESDRLEGYDLPAELNVRMKWRSKEYNFKVGSK
jgi:hypothetical protein